MKIIYFDTTFQRKTTQRDGFLNPYYIELA